MSGYELHFNFFFQLSFVNLLVSSSLVPRFTSSLTGATAHAFIGHEHSAITPKHDDVPQSHSRAEPSREHAVRVRIKKLTCFCSHQP